MVYRLLITKAPGGYPGLSFYLYFNCSGLGITIRQRVSHDVSTVYRVFGLTAFAVDKFEQFATVEKNSEITIESVDLAALRSTCK